MTAPREFDPEADLRLSYTAAIAELRRRYLAGDRSRAPWMGDARLPEKPTEHDGEKTEP